MNTILITNLGLSIIARYKEICGLPSEMPENGYYGKEIIAIAQKLYDEHKDTYLDKDLDYFKKLGTEEMVGHKLGEFAATRKFGGHAGQK